MHYVYKMKSVSFVIISRDIIGLETLPYVLRLIRNYLKPPFYAIRIPSLLKGILILPVNTLMQKVCPRLSRSHALVMQKEILSRDNLRKTLDGRGISPCRTSFRAWEYATRGTLLDLFPMGSEFPYRIDFSMMK